jgi:hypothetical protein
VTTIGVAAVAALEMIGRSEDQIRTFIIEVFGREFSSREFRSLF